jgi:hypothetical protein
MNREEAPDKMKSGTTRALVTVALILPCAIPPILVEHTTMASRVSWLGFLIVLIIAGGGAAISHYRVSGKVMDDYSGPYARQYFTLLCAALLGAFSATIAMSVAFANLSDSSGWLGSIAKHLPTIVDPVFPWIEQFRYAHISSPSNIQAIKVEAIMSLSFIFGLIAVASLPIYFGFMPKVERKDAAQQAKKYRKPSSKSFMLLAVIFGIYVALSNYMGWGEFVPSTARKFCFMHVPCYFNNDLTIIVAAAAKCFAIFVFGVGSLPMLYKIFTEPEVQNDGGPKDIRNI